MRIPDLTIFTIREKIKYILGYFARNQLIRTLFDFNFLFSEKAFYYNNRKYFPKRIERGLFRLSVIHPKFGLIQSFVRRNSSDINVFKQILEFDLMYKQIIKSGEVIIDAGANIGLVSIMLSLQNPQIRIFAIEPDNSNYRLMIRNITLNGRRNIIPLKKALWIETGNVLLGNAFRDKKSWSRSLVSAQCASSKSYVEAINLQDMIREYCIENIALFKIDIEGAEKELLRSSIFCEQIAISCKRLFIEIHEECIKIDEAIHIFNKYHFHTSNSNEHLLAINQNL